MKDWSVFWPTPFDNEPLQVGLDEYLLGLLLLLNLSVFFWLYYSFFQLRILVWLIWSGSGDALFYLQLISSIIFSISIAHMGATSSLYASQMSRKFIYYNDVSMYLITCYLYFFLFDITPSFSRLHTYNIPHDSFIMILSLAPFTAIKKNYSFHPRIYNTFNRD